MATGTRGGELESKPVSSRSGVKGDHGDKGRGRDRIEGDQRNGPEEWGDQPAAKRNVEKADGEIGVPDQTEDLRVGAVDPVDLAVLPGAAVEGVHGDDHDGSKRTERLVPPGAIALARVDAQEQRGAEDTDQHPKLPRNDHVPGIGFATVREDKTQDYQRSRRMKTCVQSERCEGFLRRRALIAMGSDMPTRKRKTGKTIST